jgi:hypothetical protein
MAGTFLAGLLRNSDNVGFKLIPHIEEAAIRYVVHNTVMASRVTVKTDMTGWNVRKVSEYLRSRRAVDLEEDTEIPDTSLVRARKTWIEPKEVGDRYRLTNRRESTDRESILADIIEALGLSISERVEVDLLDTAVSTFRGGTLGNTSADYSLNLMLQGAALMRARARHGALYHVIHPFQALTEMEKLIQYSNATQQASLDYRNQAASALMGSDLRSFKMPTFGITDMSISELLPRRVTFKLIVHGDGGTFRLQLGNGYDLSGTTQNITAAITVSDTPATTASNVAAAINALPLAVRGGTWACTGSDNADLTVTPPADFYINDPDNLRIANKYDEDAAILGQLGVTIQKSAYDLVTDDGGDPTGDPDMNGNPVGVEIQERAGATARSLLYRPDALVWDIRQGIQSFYEPVMQGRTVEYSANMVYATEQWSPENGIFIITKAEAPNAVAS